MALTTLLVCEVTRRRLGDDGLAELAACLWPVDCQSCGRLLGDEPPAVCVDDLTVLAVASLHHQRCRTPGWNDSGTVIAGTGLFTTFVARMVLLPVVRADGGAAEALPLMVVNPGLECVQLRCRDDGRWQVSQNDVLVQAGLVRPGPDLPVGVLAGGLVARVTEATVAVVLQFPPFTVYEAPADARMLDRARMLGGLLFAATPTLNPGDLDASELRRALADPRTLAGWAGLHGAHRRPRRRFWQRAEICVLHWDSEHLSAGVLVARAPRRLTDDRARSWAGRVIGSGQDKTLTWRPVSEGRPGEGWRACEPVTARQYILRRHPDRWNLIADCGQTSGDRAETDNEAKAWAADVLKFGAGISGVTWHQGPSMPGSLTWYGISS